MLYTRMFHYHYHYQVLDGLLNVDAELTQLEKYTFVQKEVFFTCEVCRTLSLFISSQVICPSCFNQILIRTNGKASCIRWKTHTDVNGFIFLIYF